MTPVLALCCLRQVGLTELILSVSAMRTGLCQVRSSLIPDGTGYLPAFSVPDAFGPAQ